MPSVKMRSPQEPPMDYCIEKTYHNIYEVKNGVVEIPEGKYQSQDIDTFKIRQFKIIKGETVTEAIERMNAEDINDEDKLTDNEIELIQKKFDEKKKETRCQHWYSEARQCKMRPLKGKKYCRHHLPKKVIERDEKKREKEKKKRTRNNFMMF